MSSNNSENFFERLGSHRVRIGKWHMTIGEWIGSVAMVVLGPLMGGMFLAGIIAAIFSDINDSDFEALYSRVYWWAVGFAAIIYFFIAKDEAEVNTWSIEEDIRRERIRSSEAYKFKIRHIESLKGYLGDYYAENLEKDIFKEKE